MNLAALAQPSLRHGSSYAYRPGIGYARFSLFQAARELAKRAFRRTVE